MRAALARNVDQRARRPLARAHVVVVVALAEQAAGIERGARLDQPAIDQRIVERLVDAGRHAPEARSRRRRQLPVADDAMCSRSEARLCPCAPASACDRGLRCRSDRRGRDRGSAFRRRCGPSWPTWRGRWPAARRWTSRETRWRDWRVPGGSGEATVRRADERRRRGRHPTASAVARAMAMAARRARDTRDAGAATRAAASLGRRPARLVGRHDHRRFDHIHCSGVSRIQASNSRLHGGRDRLESSPSVGGARNLQLLDLDAEAARLADRECSAPARCGRRPGARSWPGMATDRAGVTEEGHRQPLLVVEVADEAEPAAVAHVVHDLARRPLAFLAGCRRPCPCRAGRPDRDRGAGGAGRGRHRGS